MALKKHSPLPGFGLTLGFTLFYLSVVVLIPLGALALRASSLTWAEFWKLATTDRALAAYRLTFGASFIAALVNADCVLIGEEPRIAGLRAEMRDRLAAALGVAPGLVNVRATTTDALGFTGRGEGLAAQAIALVTTA